MFEEKESVPEGQDLTVQLLGSKSETLLIHPTRITEENYFIVPRGTLDLMRKSTPAVKDFSR